MVCILVISKQNAKIKVENFPLRWDNVWLNEAFANTLMYFAMEKIRPDFNVVQYFLYIFCHLHKFSNDFKKARDSGSS